MSLAYKFNVFTGNFDLVNTTTGGSSGYQAPTGGAVNGSNQVFTWATAPNVIVVDNVPKQRVNSDTTVNWTAVGTTTTLALAPNYDLYALA